MKPMPASRAERIATALVVVGLGAVGFVPLFEGPGYEAAVAAGALLPAAAAIATALDVAAERPVAPLSAWVRGVATGAWLTAVGLAVTFVHGLRAGFCDPLEGAEMFLLGPGAGAVLGGVWGAAAGLAARRRWQAVGLAVAGPVGGILVSLGRFYTSPMVFAFDPFFGFFAGTLYDSVITGFSRLLTYRLGSLATLLATGSAAALVRWGPSGELRLVRERRGLAVVAVLAGAGSAVHCLRGAALGHYQTAATIRAALGGSVVSGRCEVVYPNGTPLGEARGTARECDGHIRQLERYFGVRGPERIVAFVFASTDQKGYLMGAAGTYIAKPWRHEVYVQRNGYPHPVLRHELAHVIAGAFGRGPLRVSGPLGGLIPDPGRIEGVAVASAPHDEELSLAEWAKAMRDIKLLPPLERVFKLSFLGEPSSRAYVVAGAFIDWFRGAHGMEALRRWYGGEPLERVAGGKSLADLEKAWLASLDGLAVGPDVIEVAKARFDRPAIFGRRCPHVVDRLAGEAAGALGQYDLATARRLYGELLALDPRDLGARMGLVSCAEREGKDAAARDGYAGIAADAQVGRTLRARAAETLGDRALAAGDVGEAVRRYDEVAHVVVDADRLRTLDVKRWAATAADDLGRRAVLAHLFGDPRAGRDPNEAAALLGAWSERAPDLGLADYLLAKIHFSTGRWPLAAASLDRARARELPLPSVGRETLRLRIVVACGLEDPASVTRAYEQWLQAKGPRPPERAEMAEYVERCTGSRPPSLAAPEAAAPATARTGEGGAPNPTAGCPDGMVRIPGGETWIGTPRGEEAEDEWPRYRTRLAAFCLDRTEVTAEAYAACVAAGACKAVASDRVTCTAHRDEPGLPINCIDWKQASAVCAFRKARLPTEAEWEYAATGGDDRVYSWGSQPADDRACWKTNGACPVGSYPPGAFDLVDMTGNVWEWTDDVYGDYPFPPVDGPNRVYRGGGWSRRFDKWMRARLRNREQPDFSGSHLGVRCAATLPNAACPFGKDGAGECLHGVLEAECRPPKEWNGMRCAPPDEKGCGEGKREVPGHGCVREEQAPEPDAAPLDLAAVRRVRSPEFDADCGKFQAERPNAYRFEGSSHDARNAVEREAACKNRDVGNGWNSACCP